MMIAGKHTLIAVARPGRKADPGTLCCRLSRRGPEARRLRLPAASLA
jgi:hypothetical protein